MPAQDESLVDRVRTELRDAAGDPEWAEGMRAYLKSSLPCHGIRAVRLRSLMRTVLRDHPLGDEQTWRATVLALWDDARFREERFAALALARHPGYRAYRDLGALPLYEHLIRSGAWWDLVDDVATHLVRELLLDDPDQVAPVVEDWAASEDMWLRRAAIICQVGTKHRCDEHLLSTVIEANLDGSTRTTDPHSLFGREFFIRKAVGWALRDHARTSPEWVATFVAEHSDDLSGLTRREALRHLTAQPKSRRIRRAARSARSLPS